MVSKWAEHTTVLVVQLTKAHRPHFTISCLYRILLTWLLKTLWYGFITQKKRCEVNLRFFYNLCLKQFTCWHTLHVPDFTCFLLLKSLCFCRWRLCVYSSHHCGWTPHANFLLLIRGFCFSQETASTQTAVCEWNDCCTTSRTGAAAKQLVV